ncbi:MAG: hypothetical protein C4522_15625 [Desulfobacteraceae bacterium]|nr:MAG: hypothetical protein C4522_15625 [Desulfobacteraceae bacterium]
MELIFTCPETSQVFYTGNFEVIDNHGIKTDTAGNKILEAKVALVDPCPFCGRMHVYHANELACPLSGRF